MWSTIDCPAYYYCSDGECETNETTTSVTTVPTQITTLPKITTTLPFTPTEYLIRFNAGWNMFSFPININSFAEKIEEITVNKIITGEVSGAISLPSEHPCEPKSRIWHYSKGNYEEVANPLNGYGYWVEMKSDCNIKLTGEKIMIEDFPELNAGWNQIGSPSEAVNFYSVIGNCKLLSGPWWFNSASKKYEKSHVLRPGEAYFLKVEDKCKLGTEIPPLPPEELSILSKALRVR